MSTAPSLVELTRAYVAAFGAKDLAGVAALLTDDFVLEDPVVVRLEGKTAALAEIAKLFASAERLVLKARNVFQDGATTLVEFELQLDATHLCGIDLIEWEGHKMKELRAYLDIPK